MKFKSPIKPFLILCSLSIPGVVFSQRNLVKSNKEVVTESKIDRRFVQISRNVITNPSQSFLRADDIDFDRAKKLKNKKKTAELISQLEALIKRPGQKQRVGELKMRLAELYFDRSQGVAASEALQWEFQVKEWEKLSEEKRAQVARPILKTPKADVIRKRALLLYESLEKSSRVADQGRSQQIQRDEVLYFLASTLVDLGQRKRAITFYDEFVKRYEKSPRIFSARLNLADLYFETNRYAQAIPLLLLVATGDGMPKNENQNHIKAYALYKLGWSYMNTGAQDKAVLAFKKTIETARNSQNERRIVFEKEALNDLSRAFALSGQFKEGEEYFLNFKDAAALRSFYIDAASSARDIGEHVTAIQFYTKLIESQPADLLIVVRKEDAVLGG